MRRQQQSGVRPDQVRVLYHKAANQFTTGPGGTPLPTYPAAGSDYENFAANLSAFAARVPIEFPSVQAVYSTSRSYGGFTQNAARGEPLSYEEGHALNTWLHQHRDVGGCIDGTRDGAACADTMPGRASAVGGTSAGAIRPLPYARGRRAAGMHVGRHF